MHKFDHHFDVIRTLAKDRGWSKHKVKSIRGQIMKMTPMQREEYLKKIIARKGA